MFDICQTTGNLHEPKKKEERSFVLSNIVYFVDEMVSRMEFLEDFVIALQKCSEPAQVFEM